MRFTVLLILSLTSLFAQNIEYIVTEQILQERMKKEFPITHKAMFLTFKVSNPELKLDGKKQRFNFKTDLVIPTLQDANGKSVSAVVSVSSRIAYSKGGKLYLRKIKVVNIESRYISSDIKSMLYPTIDELLNDYFKSRPVYSLEKEKGMVGAAVKAIKNVVIVNNGVKVIFDLG